MLLKTINLSPPRPNNKKTIEIETKRYLEKLLLLFSINELPPILWRTPKHLVLTEEWDNCNSRIKTTLIKEMLLSKEYQQRPLQPLITPQSSKENRWRKMTTLISFLESDLVQAMPKMETTTCLINRLIQTINQYRSLKLILTLSQMLRTHVIVAIVERLQFSKTGYLGFRRVSHDLIKIYHQSKIVQLPTTKKKQKLLKAK